MASSGHVLRLGKTLRAGDLWVASSRRYKDFDEYLLPRETYQAMNPEGLGLAIDLDCASYLEQRAKKLHSDLLQVARIAKAGELPDASIIAGVLKITPLDNQEPDEAELLTRQAYAMLPRFLQRYVYAFFTRR